MSHHWVAYSHHHKDPLLTSNVNETLQILETPPSYVRLLLNCVRKCTPTRPLVESLILNFAVRDMIYTGCQQPPQAIMSLSASNRCAPSKLSSIHGERERKMRVTPDPRFYSSAEKKKILRCFYESEDTFSPDINGSIN